MPQTAIVAVSRGGTTLARAVARALAGDKTLYLERRFLDSGDAAIPNVVPFDLPLRPVVQQVFAQYQRVVLFLPVGATVRLLAPCLRDKHLDPAVVCVDDGGRFAVSLLSGHLGGADRLAEEVAGILGATSVITSGSHAAGTLAVDLLGQEFDWRLEAEPLAVTRASAAVVNGDPVGVYQEAGEPGWWHLERPLPANLRVYPSLKELQESPCVAALIITDQLAPPAGGAGYSRALKGKFVVVYRPRSLVVGMGCRRGVPVEELEVLLVETFQEHNLSLESLRCIATAELKRDEVGINQLAERYGVPVVCYSAEELNSQFPQTTETEDAATSRLGPTPSPVAYRLLGVWGVSEPAALLASGNNELLVTRLKTNRATIAVARTPFNAILN